MFAVEDKYPGRCLAMMGLHPKFVKRRCHRSVARSRALAREAKLLALGEMGTDLYWDKTFWPEQQEAFRIPGRMGEEVSPCRL